MSWLDNLFRNSGIPTLDPHASRGTFYGGIMGVVLLHIVIATVVGAWARDALVWTAPYKLYAALAFWILWQIPSGVVESIKTANRMAPKCPGCDDGPHREPDGDKSEE